MSEGFRAKAEAAATAVSDKFAEQDNRIEHLEEVMLKVAPVVGVDVSTDEQATQFREDYLNAVEQGNDEDDERRDGIEHHQVKQDDRLDTLEE